MQEAPDLFVGFVSAGNRLDPVHEARSLYEMVGAALLRALNSGSAAHLGRLSSTVSLRGTGLQNHSIPFRKSPLLVSKKRQFGSTGVRRFAIQAAMAEGKTVAVTGEFRGRQI